MQLASELGRSSLSVVGLLLLYIRGFNFYKIAKTSKLLERRYKLFYPHNPSRKMKLWSHYHP